MSYTLLLADDSVTVQRVIELTFADEGFKVVSFSDGDEVVGYLGAGNKPDVILADTTMPARDGYDVAAWVRGQASLSQVPVVLMTGAFEPIDDRRAEACQADAVLVKPFEPQQVVSLVKRMLGGERGESLGEFAPPRAGSAAPPAEGPAATLAPGVDTYASRLDQHLAARQGRAGLARVEFLADGPDAAAPVEARADADEPAAAPAPAAAPSSSLASAFSAILAEERGEGPAAVGPPAATAAGGGVITDAFIEEVASRVVARLTDKVLREEVTRRVLDVAERLISEEIARIKAGAR
ncbi:response regulator [Luteitalea sp. TBR-22]|uniref:response regulator n=1 Tax=Luteitalea sp. TBR-22 TaxID=2802971 RepID=UPI001EF64641|nr:response regulator [Luteitalea sp. TBR-22]